MHDLSASELLAAWERGQSVSPLDRALLLLAAADPGASPEELAALSIGRRDERLLRLRERLFGSALDALGVCPECDAKLELRFGTDELLDQSPRPPSPGEGGMLTLDALGYHVRFRVPTSADLRAVALVSGVDQSDWLLARCVEAVAAPAEAAAPDELPRELSIALAERMAEADPIADLQLAMACPECAAAWSAPFDPVAYFWTEIDAWAARMLHDVHTLARHYGWNEADILALGPARRRTYLELIRG